MREQKITDLLGGSPERRLSIALEMIGAEPSDPKHHRHNLVSQIMLYAVSKKDTELEAECEKTLARIKSE